MAADVAPWLLGCPGTRRQHPVSAARLGFRRPDKMAAPGTFRHRLSPGQEVILEQSSGLLIRGFGVQVPGGAPVLTWSLSLQVIFHVPVLSPEQLLAASGTPEMAEAAEGLRLTALNVRRLLTRPLLTQPPLQLDPFLPDPELRRTELARPGSGCGGCH
jgi:hypothetical protein